MELYKEKKQNFYVVYETTKNCGKRTNYLVQSALTEWQNAYDTLTEEEKSQVEKPLQGDILRQKDKPDHNGQCLDATFTAFNNLVGEDSNNATKFDIGSSSTSTTSKQKDYYLKSFNINTIEELADLKIKGPSTIVDSNGNSSTVFENRYKFEANSINCENFSL